MKSWRGAFIAMLIEGEAGGGYPRQFWNPETPS
jgi:hypothetical protein